MSELHYKLETFEGPLHLLLEMIESEKLPISKVALATVTDQFLRHVEVAEQQHISVETIVDFLYIASRLLYVKSKYVLSAAVVQEDEDELALEEQLKLFRAYQEASKLLQEVVNARKPVFGRQTILALRNVESGTFQEPVGVNREKIAKAFEMALSRLQFVIPRKELVYEKAISIREKIERIKSLLLMTDRMNFQCIVGEQATKTDVIVSFLALLELAKQRMVMVEQDVMFEEITVRRNS